MRDPNSFGYPHLCDDCAAICADPGRSLKVGPYYQPGGSFRLMLVGQDPTVRKRPDRVTQALMLNQPGGQLHRWLRGLVGETTFDEVTVYATNVVKCSFSKPPSDFHGGGLPFLLPYAENCRRHLAAEIASYRPDVVLALGEPSHKILRMILDDPEAVPDSMKEAFSGHFTQVSINHIDFDYTPCLHIQGFRVAETYGPRVAAFKTRLAERLKRAL